MRTRRLILPFAFVLTLVVPTGAASIGAVPAAAVQDTTRRAPPKPPPSKPKEKPKPTGTPVLRRRPPPPPPPPPPRPRPPSPLPLAKG